MNILLLHIFCLGTSVGLSLWLTPFIIKAALRRNVTDVPDNNLKKHAQPVPYLGGVSVYMAFIVPLALAYPVENSVLWLLLGVTLLLFVGLIDDLLVLRALQKFTGQLIAVVCFLKGGFVLKSVFFTSPLNVACAAFWMLSVINAFNLIDVMDGLSTITAIVASSTFFFMALYLQAYTVSLLLASFIGALIGFFIYNEPPAKIYLGDAGALFIGGFLAAIPIVLPWSDQSFDAYYAPAIVLAIPLIEVVSLIIIRSYLGIPFYQGSPHHFSLYLKRRGWSVWKILLFVIGSGTSLSLMAFSFLCGQISLLLLCVLFACFLLTWSFVIFGWPLKIRFPQSD